MNVSWPKKPERNWVLVGLPACTIYTRDMTDDVFWAAAAAAVAAAAACELHSNEPTENNGQSNRNRHKPQGWQTIATQSNRERYEQMQFMPTLNFLAGNHFRRIARGVGPASLQWIALIIQMKLESSTGNLRKLK